MALESRLTSISHDLVRDGYSVADDLLDADLVDALALAAKQRHTDGQLIRAGTGKDRANDASVRGDSIAWLETSTGEQPVNDFLMLLEELRCFLNEQLFLNLHDIESHFALYPPGTGYQKHLDQFATGDQRRQISLIFYLNHAWSDADNGQLRLHLDSDDHSHVDILPVGGRLVLFESSRFWHEVRPTSRPRLSIAGWLRTRS